MKKKKLFGCQREIFERFKPCYAKDRLQSNCRPNLVCNTVGGVGGVGSPNSQHHNSHADLQEQEICAFLCRELDRCTVPSVSPSLFQLSISLIPETGSSLNRHPFLLFGLPFIATILAGSFFLTPVTAIRYDKYDRKVQRMSQEEAMGLEKGRRKIDMNEEYYVSAPL